MNVKYSVEFNAMQVARLLREKEISSLAVASVSVSEKDLKIFADALAKACDDAVKPVVCADLLRRMESVTACETCGTVLFLERYGVSVHRHLDEAVDMMRVQNVTVLGVVAVK
ncbi:MAG: hypothetical protein IIW31_01755 [Clostridia bacterium]|nr:hypothetical protein [Clostridia bacterium]